MTAIAGALAAWACGLRPDGEDLALAERSLRDTVAVAIAGRDHPLTGRASVLSEAGRWAVAAHVLDFDDLHTDSTAHISAVVVPAVLAAGGDERTYLAAAGVMARLGQALGWPHYLAGWHATCTAGAPAAAVAGALAAGLDAAQIATAIALAIPGAGGVQRAFGSDAKALQVGFAVETGLRAARLAGSGVDADLAAVEDWMRLVSGSPTDLELDGPAVPGGLAVKLYPACYALQRPISALAGLGVDPATVTRILVRTPASTVTPLIHPRPETGLQAKFSLEYAVAAALLDEHTGFGSFTDDAVGRPAAQRLLRLVETETEPGGDGLLAGELVVEVHTTEGGVVTGSLQFPPGSPSCPPTDSQLRTKIADCVKGTGLDVEVEAWTWATAAEVLRRHL